MNITTLADATSLLRILMKNGDTDRLKILKYVSLCGVIAHELRIGAYGLDGVDFGVQEFPLKIGEAEKTRADILLELADMYLNLKK